VLVDELVVTARERGPAFWRVSDADTTVYVLGVPSVTPKGLAWDRSGLERRLDGANEVILPFNQLKVGVLGAPGAAFNLLRLKSNAPYEERLPPELKARFVAARTAIGHPAKDYRTNNGIAAGLLLVSHYRDHARLTAADPAKTIGRLARSRKVKVEQKAYAVGPVSGALIRAPADAQRACLEDALDETERGAAAAQRAGQGWADGDVRTALSAERGFEKCLNAAPGGLAFDARIKADEAAAIAKALKTPGHAVAVVPLRPLLAQGGVLDRLQADGFTVKTPGEEEEDEEARTPRQEP
jgi:uncharacterized protein YbaP (TraB family)